LSLHFGSFTFNPAALELVRRGQRVALSPKARELLLALLEARPRALSRAEIHDRLWPSTFVSEASLRQVVMELRHVLGDEPREPRFVRTVRRFGYAFSATVHEDVGAVERVTLARCALLRAGRELPLGEGENVLGREPDAAIRLVSDKASRRHARIVVFGTRAVIEDLGSKNGTRVNGKRIGGELVLEPGDRIEIGREVLMFCLGGAKSTRTDLD
jgi:DNA-binding winged helix-turn-helix (wHTH) protein